MVYFLLTLFFTVLMTFVLPFVLMMFGGMSSFGAILCILMVMFAAFWLMRGYGYVIMIADSPHKPLRRLWLYVPVLLPLMWYLLNTGICNVGSVYIRELGRVLPGLWGGHAFGFCSCLVLGERISELDVRHIELLGNLLYDAVLIVGFAEGERCSVKETGVERKPFFYHKKAVIIAVVVALGAYGASEVVLYKERENIVTPVYRSYNFDYAGGFSSIDLRNYSVENEENILAKLEEPAAFTIEEPQEMPVMDGAEAAYPVYSAFANACYINISAIQKRASESDSDAVMPIQFTNTIYAYEKLLSGEIDIFFGARPSEAQLQMAAEAGVEFSFEFGAWNNGIQNLYGLEIRIARELSGENRRANIPPHLLEYCLSKRVKKELSYPRILREDKIADCSNVFLETELLLALYNIIGLGETGLYPELNENWEKLEEAINIYIDCLRTYN
ncbi:MAG: hypothetical protein NC092_02710 [Butyrivibrio sp.]|nr:hypothetical protein [Muribaculum sp.]MCM1551585.1 hypothetical protein [Butyrivibrio sp.]